MREFSVETVDASLYVVEGGAGPVLMILHGGMADHRVVLPMIEPLAGRYRVVAPDLRGSGRSHCGAALTFDGLADDVGSVLDQLGAVRAIIGGVSGGSGIALRFALRYPERVLGLVLVRPVYAGEDRGYTACQAASFAKMDAVAGRALAEGVQVLQPLYSNLPPDLRERALAMIEGFDPASVVATGHFIASGAQPFRSADELRSLQVPTLLVRGDDPMHPAEVSDLYASTIPHCASKPAATTDLAAVIGEFADRCRDCAAAS